MKTEDFWIRQSCRWLERCKSVVAKASRTCWAKAVVIACPRVSVACRRRDIWKGCGRGLVRSWAVWMRLEGANSVKLLKAKKPSGCGRQRSERPSCGVVHGGGLDGEREYQGGGPKKKVWAKLPRPPKWSMEKGKRSELLLLMSAVVVVSSVNLWRAAAW